MKWIYAGLAACAASTVIYAAPLAFSAGGDEPEEPKVYELTMVEKGKKLKVITPGQLQDPRAVSEFKEFSIYAVGKIEDVDFTLIDANENEAFDEKGADAYILGKSNYALSLSRIISVKNKLYECEVETSGERITLTPYHGEAGEVDMITNFKCALKPEMAILRSGDIYLDVSRSKNARAPYGDYTLWLGYIADKKGSMAIRTRNMKPINVGKSEDKDGKKKPVQVQWGAPFQLDCSVTIQDRNVSVSESVTLYGSAGEEYYNFKPGLLPVSIEILDKDKKSVAKGSIARSVAATTQNPNTEVKGGYSGALKKGAEGPFLIKLLAKISILGELKGEKEIK
jgi:hypothetical protein